MEVRVIKLKLVIMDDFLQKYHTRIFYCRRSIKILLENTDTIVNVIMDFVNGKFVGFSPFFFPFKICGFNSNESTYWKFGISNELHIISFRDKLFLGDGFYSYSCKLSAICTFLYS